MSKVKKKANVVQMAPQKGADLKIEKNIPIPERYSRHYFAVISDMKPGDSVFFPKKQYNIKRAVSGARYVANKHGIQLVSRTQDTGVRVWRV